MQPPQGQLTEPGFREALKLLHPIAARTLSAGRSLGHSLCHKPTTAAGALRQHDAGELARSATIARSIITFIDRTRGRALSNPERFDELNGST